MNRGSQRLIESHWTSVGETGREPSVHERRRLLLLSTPPHSVPSRVWMGSPSGPRLWYQHHLSTPILWGMSPLSLQVVRRLPGTAHGLSCCRVSNLSKWEYKTHFPKSTLEKIKPGCLIGSGKKSECHSGPQDKFQSAK